MMFYARQFGLPAQFERIGWRESNCRNEDGVRTSCCHGYWQLHRMHFPMPECEAAKQLYDAAGMSPWSL